MRRRLFKTVLPGVSFASGLNLQTKLIVQLPLLDLNTETLTAVNAPRVPRTKGKEDLGV